MTNRSYHHLAVRNCGVAGRVVDAWGLIRIRSDWVLQQKVTSEEDRANFGIYSAYVRKPWVLVVSGWPGCLMVVSGP